MLEFVTSYPTLGIQVLSDLLSFKLKFKTLFLTSRSTLLIFKSFDTQSIGRPAKSVVSVPPKFFAQFLVVFKKKSEAGQRTSQ